jgi:hypothetical protein
MIGNDAILRSKNRDAKNPIGMLNEIKIFFHYLNRRTTLI